MTIKNIKRHDFSRITDILNRSKFKLFLISIICIILLTTGIIVGVKTAGNCDEIEIAQLFSFGSSFWGSFFSMAVITIIIFGCCFCKWLFPLSLLLLSYRAYLLGLNLTLIIVFNGFTGIISGILIILPCQIAALAVMTIMCLILCRMNRECSGGKERVLVILVVLAALIILSVLETVLFALLSPNVILIV